MVDIGIVSFGYAFGEDTSVAGAAADYVSDPDRVVKWGYHTFHRAPDGVTGTDLSRGAAEQALSRAGITADALDLVVVAITDMPEYSYWDSASALARELKIGRTQTLLLQEGCGSGVNGLFYVASTLALQPEAEYALFVVVNRVSEFHRNRMNVINTVLSDAAVAVVVRRGHTANRWLASEQFTDPEYSDLLRLDFGGAVTPLPPSAGPAPMPPPPTTRCANSSAATPPRCAPSSASATPASSRSSRAPAAGPESRAPTSTTSSTSTTSPPASPPSPDRSASRWNAPTRPSPPATATWAAPTS